MYFFKYIYLLQNFAVFLFCDDLVFLYKKLCSLKKFFEVVHLFFLIRILAGGVHTGSTRHVGHFWTIVPAPGDCEDGEFGRMKISKGKPAPAPLCPPQIPLYQTRARTRAAAVGSQRLTAWAMARSFFIDLLRLSNFRAYSVFFLWPNIWYFKGLRSGECGGQISFPPRAIHRLWNCSFVYNVTFLIKCRVSMSC
jgi:hypothetical protein